MLTIDKDNNIFLTRGDTAYIRILEFTKDDDTVYYLQDGDRIYFRMRTTNNRILPKEFVIDFENNSALLTLIPDDTILLPIAIHKYEVELVTNIGEHFTFIANKNFEIGPEQEVHYGT